MNNQIVLEGFIAGRTSKRYNESIDEIGLDAMAWEIYKGYVQFNTDNPAAAQDAYQAAQYFLDEMNRSKNKGSSHEA